MLDDTGGDPAVEPPQIFSDKDPTQPRQVPDPQDPLASNPYGINTRPAESYAPDWAKADLIAPINPELRKRNEARYDPNFLDRVFKTIGLPAGFGRQVTADDQKQIEADRKKAVEDARKTITEQILYPGSAALDGPVDQPVNPFVLGQNVEQNAVVKKAEQTVAQGKPEMEAWRNFTENSIQGLLTTLVSLPRGLAQGVDVPRAIGAWLRGNENLDQNVVAERLQKVTQDIQAAIPGDPGRKTELLTTLGQGTGSMAGFLTGGAALRGIGMSFNRATMLAGATTGGTQMYDDAEAHGAGVAGRYFSFLVGSALGATEALPIDRAFYWLNKEGGGIVHRMLRSAAIDGLTEMGQEVGQQLGQNLTAKFIYDHEREIFDGVKDAGLAAGIIGSMFGLGLHSVHALTAKHARRKQLEAAQKAQADLQGQTPPSAAGSPPASNVAPAAGVPAAGRDVPGNLRQAIAAGRDVPGRLNPAPGVSAQITPQQALETNVPLELPVDPIFSQAVQNTEGAQITPDGLLIDVVRFQKPNMEGAQAVRTGVFYLPSSSSQVRYYRNSKTGYGGEARFGGETLIRKPLFVKGATGGAAPEAAYAQLKGKEALKEMTGDAMRVVTRGGNYIRPDLNLKVSLINEFLDKYAPELSGSGSFIESVSREGNTLRYALQELAVAHAARAAGYDAVVGYSGSKTGPKISEVFDLREQTFPARGVESRVHEDFSQLKERPPAEGAPPAFADAPAAADPTQEPVVPPEQMQPLLPPGVTDLFAIAGKNGALVTGVPDAQPAPQDGDVSGIVRAYHGSPHTFDRFSMDKIGTGEGAQAYGHGLYFAESEGVARSYRDTLSAPRGESPEDIAGRVYEAFKQDRQGAIAELQRRVDSLERRRVEDPASVPSDMRAGETALHKALAYLKSGATPGGALYEVVINANPDDFLDWDKPLSQQPQALKDYLAKADLSHLPEGGRLRRTIEAYRKNPGDWVPPPGASIPEPMGHQIYDALTEYGGGAARNAALTKAMLDAGIPGVKYLDAGSRSQGDGSRNYVVFDENLVRIVKRNGQDAGGDVSAILAPEKPRPLYPLERARSMAGIPEKAPTAEPTASKKDIAERFKEALDLVVKQGRFGRGSSKAEAIYKWGQSVARVKNEGQLLELFHEGGHHLHSILDTLLEPLISKHQSEIYMIADKLYGGGGQIKAGDTLAMRREGFATFFQVYMNNPAEARVIAPGFLPEFEALMEENKPGIQKELQAIREEVDAWLTSKSSAQLARERVISNKPLGVISKIAESIKGGTVLHDVATLANRVYQATLNDQHPLTLAARKLLKIAEENIRVQIERGLINRQQALQQLEALTRRGRANPVKMATLARNSYHASSEMIASGWAKYGGDGSPASKGLAEILKDVMKGKRLDQKLYDDFNTYLAMRRVVTEWKNYYATLKWDHAKNYGPASANAGAQEPPVNRFRRPDDVSMGDAQQAIKDIEAANPHFAVAAGHVYQFLDEMLQYKVDAGILTQEAADMQRQIADYVPLRREMDDTKSGTVGQGKDARTGKDNLIRVFRGSSRRIISPIESIMQQAHETVALVAKNDVKRSLAQLALDVGKGSGAVMEKIPASTMKGTSVKLADVIKAAGDFSLAEEVAQAMGRDEITMQEFLDEVLDGDEVGTIWRKADISEKGDPIVYVWNNGELEAYQLNDPEWADDLFNALTELGKEQTNLAIQILGVPSAVLRAGVTTAPPFLIANLVRDQLGAWVLNDGVYPGVTMGKGIASDLFDRKARRLYNLSMASIGGSNIAALDKTRFGTEQTMLAKIGIGVTAEDSMTTALRAIESTETFTRQGIWQSAFKKAKADGLNDADAMLEAGFEASDFANYGRAGSKMLLARRLVTFLNANLQNMDKSLRVSLGGEAGAAWLRKELAPWVRRQLPAAALSRMGLDGSQTSLPMTAAEKKQLARAGRTLTKMMMMLAIPSALLAALYWDDEEYQDMSPYLKGTRWMVKVAPGKWLAIPKPFQLATFATFTEYAIESVLREDPTAMTKFMQSQAGVIAPPFENPFIKMFYELYTNKDTFSGRDIVTPSVAARPGWLQYDEYTSELAKSIGYFTGASPMVVDHVITGSFATWGRGMQSASNLLNPNRPAQGFDDFAFTSYFVKDGSRSSTVRPAFLDLVGQQQGALAGAYSGYRNLMDGGAEGQAADLLNNLTKDQKVFALLYYHQEADAKKLHPLRNAYDIAQTISGLRKELILNRVKEGGKDDGELITLSPTQQKLLNDRLSDLQVRVQRNALVITKQPGFAGRKILPTYPLVEEIKAIDPRIAADLKKRMGSRIYPTDVVAKLWPQVEAEILKNQGKANLKTFVIKAKGSGNKIWSNGEAP